MTTDSQITIRVSVDICLISSICLKELSKKSIKFTVKCYVIQAVKG